MGGDYEEWLVELERKRLLFVKWVSASETYFLIRKSDDKLIRMIDIRLDLADSLREFGGHIGYGIRPLERRKGYNKINLYLCPLRCREVGFDKVMLGCHFDNLGSDKTIKALGGVVERHGIDSSNGKKINIYWIDVDKSVKGNYDKYKDFI